MLFRRTYPHERAFEDDQGDTWTTADGTTIPVKDLTDAHLANIVAYLEREYGGTCELCNGTGYDFQFEDACSCVGMGLRDRWPAIFEEYELRRDIDVETRKAELEDETQESR